jgi:hypothetical protein
VRGETVAVAGSKFRAVSSAKSVREREATKRYLEQLDATDEQEEVGIDQSAVQAALKKLKKRSGAGNTADACGPTVCAGVQRADGSRC